MTVEGPGASSSSWCTTWTGLAWAPSSSGADAAGPTSSGRNRSRHGPGPRQRDQAIERRAGELARQAIESGEVWVRRLGNPPSDPGARQAWLRALSTVAACRNRWGIGTDQRSLGPDSAVRTIEAIGHRSTSALPGSIHQAGDEEVLMRYSVVYEQGDTSWGAYVPDLPGCVAVGESRAEVEGLIVEAIVAYFDDLREAEQPIPEPRSATGLVEVA